MTLANVLLNPNGRIGRKAFWIGVAVLLVANSLAFVAAQIVSEPQFVPVLGFIGLLFLIYVGVCVYGKRLHDGGKSAWAHIIPWVGFFALLVVSVIMLTSDPAAAEAGADTLELYAANHAAAGVLGLSLAVWLGWTGWVGALKSDPAANRHGPPGASAADPADPESV